MIGGLETVIGSGKFLKEPVFDEKTGRWIWQEEAKDGIIGKSGLREGKASEIYLKRTYSPAYTQKLKNSYTFFLENGYDTTEHALNRIQGRINQGKIGSMEDVLDTLRTGTRYRDTLEGGDIIYKNGISIHFTEDGIIKTVVGKARVKPHWEEIK